MAKLQSRREVMHICNPSLLECKLPMLLPRRWRGRKEELRRAAEAAPMSSVIAVDREGEGVGKAPCASATSGRERESAELLASSLYSGGQSSSRRRISLQRIRPPQQRGARDRGEVATVRLSGGWARRGLAGMWHP
jgi:hypothetical protein